MLVLPWPEAVAEIINAGQALGIGSLQVVGVDEKPLSLEGRG